jgi:putative hydrolase of the HAD superfamily
MKTLLFDFSRVILFVKDSGYTGKLNFLYHQNKDKPGFNYTDHFRFNEELLTFLKQNQSSFHIHIFTSLDIQNHPVSLKKIQPIFDHILSAHDLGVSKKDPEAYSKVCRLINQPPGEVTFIDDTLENVEAAQASGLNAFQYTNSHEVIKKLETLK